MRFLDNLTGVGMEIHHHQQQWKSKLLSYKNATIVLCFLNLIASLLLLHGFFAGSDRSRTLRSHQSDLQLKYLMESEELRRTLEPVELIKRIKEIEEEVVNGLDPEIKQVPKQTAAVDLSKRLKDLRAMNDANSQRALDEWRKRKMDRARQREIEKN